MYLLVLKTMMYQMVLRMSWSGLQKGHDGFEELKDVIKSGEEFCREVAAVLQERADLELSYSKYVKSSDIKDVQEAIFCSDNGQNILCPRRLDPFYIVTYYTKWVKTSSKYRTEEVQNT